MKRAGLLRRFLIRCGLLTCLLLGIAWALSTHRNIWYAWTAEILMPYDTRLCGIGAGGLYYQAFHPSAWDDYMISTKGWNIETADGGCGFSMPAIATREYRTKVWIPFWLILTIVSLPTLAILLWPRRRMPGSCQNCNYNLTGNVSGTCPECGCVIGVTNDRAVMIGEEKHR